MNTIKHVLLKGNERFLDHTKSVALYGKLYWRKSDKKLNVGDIVYLFIIQKYHFAWQTWRYIDMYDNNWNKLFDLYYKKYGEGFNIAIDDQSDHNSSYYIRMIEDCIERYVKFIDNHNEKISQ